MTDRDPNADQEDYWSSAPGRKWLRYEETLDALLRAPLDRLLARAGPAPGDHAIDVGCGTGASAVELARLISPGGSVLAIDISEPLLDRARGRAGDGAPISFVRADAQVHGFAPGGADLVVSRFGVMFFADPAAAFRNLRTALRPGGRAFFVAWASLDENPWFSVPLAAAVARLGRPEPASPNAPGPLAFADRTYVTGILRQAGYADIAVEAETVDLDYRGRFEDLVDLAVNVGPATRIMQARGGGPEDGAAIREAVATALERFRVAGGVRVPAVCNVGSGRQP